MLARWRWIVIEKVVQYIITPTIHIITGPDLRCARPMQARCQDLEKGGGGFFERVRKVQTTLTRIFIVLESVSHGLSENWDGISRKAESSNVFSAQKQVVSKKKKKVFTEIESDFSAKIGNSNDFSAKRQVVSKKKKVFAEIESNFSAKIALSNTFSHRITTSISRLRHPISFGGGCFQFFTKNRPKKQQKRAILHTSQANGGARAPPGYATGPMVLWELLQDFCAKYRWRPKKVLPSERGAPGTVPWGKSPPPLATLLGPWYFGNICKIFVPNIGEDQKKSYHLNVGPLALCHEVNLFWLLHYVHKKIWRGPEKAAFKQKTLISPGFYI